MGRSKQDRNDASLAGVVALEGALHFLFITIRRGNEVRADEEENDVGLFKVFVDGAGPIGSGLNAPVVPWLDKVLALEDREMRLKLVAERFILVGVAVEEAKGSRRGGRFEALRRGGCFEHPEVANLISGTKELRREMDWPLVPVS